MKNFKKIALIVLTVVLFLACFVACDQNTVPTEPQGTKDAHVHSFAEATCTAPKTCECGATEGEALGHAMVTDAAVEATCTEDGLTAGEHCSRCDHKVAQTKVDAKGHDHKSVVTAPTCTADGYTTYTCACGDTYKDNEVKATGHDYQSVVTAPTCTADGYTTYTCACGDTYKDDEVEATGHTFINSKCACGAEYVAAPATGDWALVTELKDGDKVLIGAPAYGKLLSAVKVATYYNKGVEYSADNFDNVTDDEIFVVTVNDDGSYTFTSLTGKVIALAASFSSLNETGEHKSWTLTAKDNGTFLVYNTGRKTYLEWYSSKANWSTYTAGNTDEYYLSFYAKSVVADGDHVHNHITSVTAPTCTVDGYTTYACACGDTYTADEVKATGHDYKSTVTDPTCTVDGYTTYACECGDSYTVDGETAPGHSFADGSCTSCGAEDPDYHVHNYNYNVVNTATCTAAGTITYTCSCGESYSEDAPQADHVDANLDITCDFDGCTKRILPAADSKISLFTANHMIIVSLNSSYYVEGVVTEITDAKNGIFIITDEAGDTILIRLPKDANGNSYSAWTEGKVVVGDTVSVYGKPAKNSSAPTTQKAKVEGGLLTIVKHEHSYSEATCTEDSVCACGAVGTLALGHIDENGDKSCDRCTWNMNLKVEDIAIGTAEKYNGVLDDAQTNWKWSGENFTAEIAKGTSTVTLYKTAKDYMQLKKQNTFTLINNTGATISYVVIRTTNATQFGNLKKAIGDQFTFTEDAENLTVKIELNATGNFTFSNVSTTTAYISGIEVVYEPAA